MELIDKNVFVYTIKHSARESVEFLANTAAPDDKGKNLRPFLDLYCMKEVMYKENCGKNEKCLGRGREE